MAIQVKLKEVGGIQKVKINALTSWNMVYFLNHIGKPHRSDGAAVLTETNREYWVDGKRQEQLCRDGK